MPANTTAEWSASNTRSPLLSLLTALPLIVLVTGASITTVTWQRAEGANNAAMAMRIDAHFRELLDTLDNQFEDHVLMLRGSAGLFAGSEEVSREEFGNYVAALRLAEYLPGVQAVGYAAAGPGAELVYIEPDNADDPRILGFDLLTDPVRRAAIEAASHSEKARMTAPVQALGGGDDGGAGELELYLADYCSSGERGLATSPGTPVCGWVIMSININSAIQSATRSEESSADSQFAIAISDNDARPGARNVYTSADFAATPNTQYQRQAELPLAGRSWTVTARPLPGFFVRHRDRTATWALATGSAFTLLTTVFFLLLARSYRRLLAVIDTSLETQRRLEASQEQLQASEHSHREMFAANPVPMWVYDRETLRFLSVNAAAIEKYGYSREEFLALTIADIRPAEERARLQQYLEVTPSAIDNAGYWQHRAKNGRSLDVDIHAHPITFNGRAAELVMAQDVTRRLQAERDLLARNGELERMNRAMVDRELKMVALKAEINSLSRTLGRPEPYQAPQLPDGNGELDP